MNCELHSSSNQQANSLNIHFMSILFVVVAVVLGVLFIAGVCANPDDLQDEEPNRDSNRKLGHASAMM